MRKSYFIASLTLCLTLCLLTSVTAKSGEDQWVWRTYNRRERAFRDKDIDRSASIRNSYDNKLRREPTTRRPLPGEPENDEIEDYVDAEPNVSSSPTVGTRQFNPYGNPSAYPGQPTAGGQFANPGGFAGGSPGVLVGPGGPTGVIGRQPYPYPGVYQPGLGGFGGAQNGLGFGSYPGVYGGAGASAYPGLGGAGNFAGAGLGATAYPGVGATYPGAGNFGGFSGAQSGAGLGLGQYPGAGNQYPFNPYQGAGTDFNSNQFAAAGGQYPGLGQFPGNQYSGPQFTEGYGLAGLGLGQAGLPPTGFGGNYGAGGFGYDEKSPAVAVAEGKSAKNVASTPSTVNNKLKKV
ncbi:spidroin-1 [Drosophila nasuta]|uniref:spidroin-1 n=1 Tax=Drosophila nasuta TaxID=42062 RepID=UPI00295EE517|nr:spidroin-1 [Drosophila nasuta]